MVSTKLAKKVQKFIEKKKKKMKFAMFHWLGVGEFEYITNLERHIFFTFYRFLVQLAKHQFEVKVTFLNA